MRRGARGPVVLVVLAALAGCGDGDGGDSERAAPPASEEAPAGPSVVGDGVVATRTWEGPSAVTDDVVAVGDTVVALASTDPGQADLLLRSPDGGRTWDEPIAAFEPGARVGGNDWIVADSLPRLHAVADLVLAVRPVNPEGGPRVVHELLASSDDGATWAPFALPVPAGRSALVGDVTEDDDGTIVVTGSLQDDAASGVSGRHGEPGITGAQGHLDAYDPAAWVSTDDGASFTAATGLGEGTPGFQALQEVLFTGDRFVARGATSAGVSQEVCCFPELVEASWASADGATWAPLDGLADPGSMIDSGWDRWRATDDGAVVIGSPGADITLPAGATTWERGEYLPTWTADLLTLDDGTLVATWEEDSACDCIIAHAGVVGAAGIDPEAQPELGFDGCEDTSVRGETGISAPWVSGTAVAALAWCNDEGRHVGAIAMSTDGGSTWTTTRLTDLAPDGSADVSVPTPYRGTAAVLVDGGALAVLPGAPDGGPDVAWDGTDTAGRLVAVRFEPPR